MIHSLSALLRAALALCLLRPVRLTHIPFGPVLFWATTLTAVIAALGVNWWATEPPQLFNPYGLQTEGFWIFQMLLVASLVSALRRTPHLFWPLACLLMACTSLFMYAVTEVFYTLLEPFTENNTVTINQVIYWGLFISFEIWMLMVILAISQSLLPYLRPPGRLALVVPVYLAVSAPWWYLDGAEFWYADYSNYASSETEDTYEYLDAEQLLFQQPMKLSDSLFRLAAGHNEKTDLYVIGFAGDGNQNVFRSEVEFMHQQMQQQFNTTDTSTLLINHPDLVNQQPLATATNLARALSVLGKTMDTEDDILFLYLTSHGSESHELSVQLRNLPLNDLPAASLASMLEASGIRWKVIVISACYSGGFIAPLADENTLIMTSARADRNSFGCGDDDELTYFGRALLQDSLTASTDFIGAFEQAKALVNVWEKAENYTPSEPQIHVGSAIQQKLIEWRQGMPDSSAGFQTSASVPVNAHCEFADCSSNSRSVSDE